MNIYIGYVASSFAIVCLIRFVVNNMKTESYDLIGLSGFLIAAAICFK